MNDAIGAVLILIVIFGFIYAMVALSVRRKERMALLAKGADPNTFHQSKPESGAYVKYGMFLIGIARILLLLQVRPGSSGHFLPPAGI